MSDFNRENHHDEHHDSIAILKRLCEELGKDIATLEHQHELDIARMGTLDAALREASVYVTRCVEIFGEAPYGGQLVYLLADVLKEPVATGPRDTA